MCVAAGMNASQPLCCEWVHLFVKFQQPGQASNCSTNLHPVHTSSCLFYTLLILKDLKNSLSNPVKTEKKVAICCCNIRIWSYVILSVIFCHYFSKSSSDGPIVYPLPSYASRQGLSCRPFLQRLLAYLCSEARVDQLPISRGSRHSLCGND